MLKMMVTSHRKTQGPWMMEQSSPLREPTTQAQERTVLS